MKVLPAGGNAIAQTPGYPGWRTMSPLFMETGYEINSPDSTSAEDCNSQTAGSEREGDGQPVGSTGKKRREKNRDAARKSRKKQTERADVLHEELQRLERSNTAYHKEIAALRKDLLRYTTALELHEPHCRLRASGSNPGPAACQPVSRTRSSPARAPSQASNSALMAARSLSTSSNSSLGLQTMDSVENSLFSSSASAPKSNALPPSPADLFIASSNPVTVPCSLPLPTPPPPHSLFSDEPVIAPKPAKVTPVTMGLISSPVPSTAFDVGARPQSVRASIHKTFSLPAGACFSTRQSNTLDALLSKQTSFLAAPSNALPPYPHAATQNGRLAQACEANTNLYIRNPNASSPFPGLQDRALQSYSVPPQGNFPSFPLKPSCSQQTTQSPASLLSLLTVPSPPIVHQTTSNSFTRSIAQAPPPPPLPRLHDTSKDLSFSELLEVNDWILSGTNN